MLDVLTEFAASPGLAAIVLAVVFAGAIVQFSLGMGFGLVVAPLMALIDPQLVPVPVLLMGVAVSGGGAFSERAAIVWPEVLTAASGRFAGAMLAALLLGSIATTDGFSLLFGLLVTTAVILSVLGLRVAFTRANVFGLAVLSGSMATITSVGAPPLAIVYQGRPAAQARPTLAMVFTFGCLFSLGGLFLSGWAEIRDLWLALILSPAALAGFFAARALGPRFDKRYRVFLLTISGAAGVALILRGLA